MVHQLSLFPCDNPWLKGPLLPVFHPATAFREQSLRPSSPAPLAEWIYGAGTEAASLSLGAVAHGPVSASDCP